MTIFDIDAAGLAELKQQRAEIRHLEQRVVKAEAAHQALCDKLADTTSLLTEQRTALAEARRGFQHLAAQLGAPALANLVSDSPGGRAAESQPLGPLEKTRWVYNKLKRRGRSAVDLCAAFTQETGRSAETLLSFLATSKYFRKTGKPGDFSWSVSKNRANDLRDYLG